MQEKLSAMVDGEWDDHELDALMASISQEEGADAWRDYHLIGDAMNQRSVLSGDFMANFSTRLEQEPAILAPNAMRRRVAVPHKRWVALSMAASVVLVSATAWYVSSARGLTVPGTPAGNELLAANQPIKVAPQVVEEVNPYLFAHQAMSGNPGFSHKPVILTGAEAERAVGHH
ncbi:sigma-E factor negative regulatory protein [Chitinimonas sp. JJ19]|uniref:sigma-E factor negative regulatory protein n=1 Tax=Chitinimonas sp. JJ19 TaxID=3109352 RepID=UPI003002C4C9